MEREEKKEAILEKQFDMATEGSIEMLKWLGIQLCGQDNKPSKASEPLPRGFDVSVIPTKGQEEYYENKEEFEKWKMEREMQETIEECKEGRLKYEESRDAI